MERNNHINWDDFARVELRVGTIVKIEEFPDARKPAYKIWVDLGEIGVKQSSAQLTKLYSKDDLMGRQVICVSNFKPKRIAGFISEILITGFVMGSGEVILAVPERPAPNGSLLA